MDIYFHHGIEKDILTRFLQNVPAFRNVSLEVHNEQQVCHNNNGKSHVSQYHARFSQNYVMKRHNVKLQKCFQHFILGVYPRFSLLSRTVFYTILYHGSDVLFLKIPSEKGNLPLCIVTMHYLIDPTLLCSSLYRIMLQVQIQFSSNCNLNIEFFLHKHVLNFFVCFSTL